MTYIPEESKVSYQSKDGKEEKVFDALEWPCQKAAGCKHSLPCAAMCLTRENRWSVMEFIRLWRSYYSNVSRGRRQKEDHDGLIPYIIEEENSEEYRKNWARLIQKIHPVEFPEGNPIQQGLLRSGLVRLRRIIPLRLMPPNSKPALDFDWGDGHGSQRRPLSRFSQNKLNYVLSFKITNSIVT